jgi:Cytochrome C oxidase, cbb3-type, subunit III
MIKKIFNLLSAGTLGLTLWACQSGGENRGLEYAPQMYHSLAYEPLVMITDSTDTYANAMPFNDYFKTGKENGKYLNMRQPVEGTVKRQNFVSVTGSPIATKDQPIFIYELHKDSADLAGRILKNPVPLDSAGLLMEEGKHLYLGFCAPCHGATGVGDGKVGAMYKGVPNYSAGRYKTLPEGHIFHVITHGKGRMWSHKSQLSPEERWKVVHYVQKLQKGES